MKTTFTTSGVVTPISNDKGEVIAYLIGRSEMAVGVRLSKTIPQYYEAGHCVYIDAYGNPWVKA